MGGPDGLDALLPQARLVEVTARDVGAAPDVAWARVRHGDLGDVPVVRALFGLRALPARLAGHAPGPLRLRIDDIASTPAEPGFAVLADDPPREVVVGAAGAVWRREIPFVHVADAAAFAAAAAPGLVRVAWALRVRPRDGGGSRIEIEVRVDPGDAAAWRRFRAYFAVVGPFSRLIRRALLRELARELGDPPMPGDALLPDAVAAATHETTIGATPDEVWPWLAQMGVGRAGFYALDAIDNGGRPSARELHPEWTALRAGDRVPADGRGGHFEVLEAQAPRALVLGGLWDADAGRNVPFAGPRPPRHWQATWAFAPAPAAGGRTRQSERARAAHPGTGGQHAAWIRPAPAVQQRVQLRNLARRAEGRARTGWRDVAAGLGGAARMAAAAATPGRRPRRATWGAGPALAARPHPGDDLVPRPRWGWTHAVIVDAPAEAVWPWIAQIGADRAGFYSYTWLENLAGCGVRDAERIHPEWQARPGDHLVLHPQAPPLTVVEVDEGRHLVAHGPPDAAARAAGRPWAAASWLIAAEPLSRNRTRIVSRYRCACSDDLRTRLAMGPALVEPVGSAMDRRMLRGVARRARTGG
ncbi:MAG: hypothetical protein AB7G65_10085 [Thermoleophilia bacterium]